MKLPILAAAVLLFGCSHAAVPAVGPAQEFPASEKAEIKHADDQACVLGAVLNYAAHGMRPAEAVVGAQVDCEVSGAFVGETLEKRAGLVVGRKSQEEPEP